MVIFFRSVTLSFERLANAPWSWLVSLVDGRNRIAQLSPNGKFCLTLKRDEFQYQFPTNREAALSVQGPTQVQAQVLCEGWLRYFKVGPGPRTQLWALSPLRGSIYLCNSEL